MCYANEQHPTLKAKKKHVNRWNQYPINYIHKIKQITIKNTDYIYHKSFTSFLFMKTLHRLICKTKQWNTYVDLKGIVFIKYVEKHFAILSQNIFPGPQQNNRAVCYKKWRQIFTKEYWIFAGNMMKYLQRYLFSQHFRKKLWIAWHVRVKHCTKK